MTTHRPGPGPIATAMREALDSYRSLRAQGMPQAEACRLLEEGLRAALPGDARDEATLFTCLACRDTGFEPFEVYMRIYQCRGRVVRFCQCEKGRAYRDNFERQEAERKGKGGYRRSGLDQIAAAVRTRR